MNENIAATLDDIGRKAKAAASVLACVTSEQKTAALKSAAALVRAHSKDILAANAKDLAAAMGKDLAAPLLDRLMLDEKRIEAIAVGLDIIAALPDPVGTVMSEWTRPNGLLIKRVRAPIGVIGIIYESRPNVTADAGGLCIKSGNAAILRGGSESFHSSGILVSLLQDALEKNGLPRDAVQMVPVTDRAAVGHMLTMDRFIDVIVPRGGKSLTGRVMSESRIPVFAHLDGVCHIYIEKTADIDMAVSVTLNAKMRRVSVCGATETLLIERSAVATHLAPVLTALKKAGCALRGDAEICKLEPTATPASEEDWSTEYLDAIISVKIVESTDAAIEHINSYGSHHTDSIITQDAKAAAKFMQRVDSGIVLHNASTQFADGGEFGFGAEIGIATGKLHARGPVGAEQLTTYKYQVYGRGQTRA